MTRPVRRRTVRLRAARVVALLVAAAAVLTGCDFSVYDLPLPGGANLGPHPYAVTIDFRDVLDLVPQSAVKVDDVTVGRVDQITLHGWTAQVRVLVNGAVKLPDNAVADIRQTSLLGEKFVSLSPPTGETPEGRLGNGDVIPLSRTGRNPEVEEVLGALSLVLNGGGVAQLKTISVELGKALSGRESDVRSVLTRLRSFMGQLDAHRSVITRALQSLDRLSVSLNHQKGTIAMALDRLPGAIRSINSQRDDLVRMLRALARLSSVGTHVIQSSKAATIDSLRALAPTLTKLAQAGSALPRSLQVFLTYPFVDAVVGTNPAQARNLHMGDYTDLSARLDLDLTGQSGGAGGGGGPVDCSKTPLAPVCGSLPPPTKTLTDIQKCLKSKDITSKACRKALNDLALYKKLKKACAKPANRSNPVCQVVNAIPGGGLPSALPSVLPSILPSVPSILPRAPYGSASPGPPLVGGPRSRGIDTELGAMLIWGLRQR